MRARSWRCSSATASRPTVRSPRRTAPDCRCPPRYGSDALRLLIVWLINTVALVLVAYLLPGVSVATFTAALVAALVLGLVNTIIRPILVLLTLPVTILTLGLFIFVINGLLFWFVGSFIQGFQVAGFWWGVLGAIVYSLISWLLTALVLHRAPSPIR